MDLHATLRTAVESGASDVHLKTGQPPVARRDGLLERLEGFAPLTEADLEQALTVLTVGLPKQLEGFQTTGELDMAYTAEGLPRFRVNVFRQRGHISFAFRAIPKKVPTFGDLFLPPGVERLANEHRGLVLVTGATGSGKTTTLAAGVDPINRTRPQHTVTGEDPTQNPPPEHRSLPQ